MGSSIFVLFMLLWGDPLSCHFSLEWCLGSMAP